MSDKPVLKPGSNLVTLLIGAGLILLGMLFLFGRFINLAFHFDIGHYAWPFFIIIPGILMFLSSFTLERETGVKLAIFGGMVVTTGALLLLQNTFDVYATWAYAWALVAPTSIGLAKMAYGALRGMGQQIKSGLRLAGIGLGLFVFGGFFFELVIGISGLRLGAAWYCFPLLLIGFGVVVLLTDLLPRRNQP